MKAMKTKENISHSLSETKEIAKDWLISIANEYGDSDEALIVGLSGHLGAGKTAFVKCVAGLLGIEDEVTSPTFVIMKMYEVESEILNLKSETNFKSKIQNNAEKNEIKTVVFPWKRLVHIDAYRLERREELEVLEWEQLVADKNNLILIEWPENVGLDKNGLDGGGLDLSLKFEADGEARKIVQVGPV